MVRIQARALIENRNELKRQPRQLTSAEMAFYARHAITPEEFPLGGLAEEDWEMYFRLHQMSRPDPNAKIDSGQAAYYQNATVKGATEEWWKENRNGLHHALKSSESNK